MTRRRRRLLPLVTAATVLGVLAGPAVRWRLEGWVRRESFYGARPTSYWGGEVAKLRPVRFRNIRDGSGHRHEILFARSMPDFGQDRVSDLAPGHPLKRSLARAYDALPLYGDPAAVSVLTELLDDRRPAVRLYAVQALGGLGDAARPAVPALRSRAGDTSAVFVGITVGEAAAKALHIIDPSAVGVAAP